VLVYAVGAGFRGEGEGECHDSTVDAMPASDVLSEKYNDESKPISCEDLM